MIRLRPCGYASLVAGVMLCTATWLSAAPVHLATDPTWLRLIAWRGQAEITNTSFYLSDSSQRSPQTELDATLQRFAKEPKSRCQFPARFYWLQLQGAISATENLMHCPNLPNAQQYIQLILVGAYLKNPASSFGHVLIGSNAPEQQRLLNDSYNFGAVVPKQDPALAYVFKGLFGQYQARFAKADFFKQDAVYAKQEQRDLWVYTLKLNPQQKALVNYHLFELQGQNFPYYFIKQNCAYRTAEILALATGLDLTARLTPWYAPDSIFHLLEEDGAALIQRVEHYPSEQSAVYTQFLSFDDALQAQMNRSIQTQDLSPLQTQDENTQIQALDFLLRYSNYRLSVDPDHTAVQQLKSKVIAQRFALPATPDELLPQPIHKVSPAKAPKPSRVAVQLGDAPSIRVAAFERSPLNPHTPIDAEFRMLDVEFSYENGRTRLQRADLISLAKYENLAQPLWGEKKWSWALNIGVAQDDFNQRYDQAFAQSGVGAAYKWQERFLAYQLFGAKLHTGAEWLDAVSTTGILYKRDQQALKVALNWQARQGFKPISDTEVTFRQATSKNQYVDLRLNLQPNALWHVGYAWTW